jgi:hypothetical protein
MSAASLLSLAPSSAGLATRRRRSPASCRRVAVLRVSAHGGVGGSGGSAYQGKDKGHDDPLSPWYAVKGLGSRV